MKCDHSRAVMGFLIFLFWGLAGIAYVLPVKAQDNLTLPPNNHDQYVNLSQSMEKTLTVEKESLEALKEQFTRLQQSQKNLDAETNAYKIQISAYSNLLLLPSTSIDDMEKAFTAQKTTLENIDQHLKEIEDKRQVTAQLRQKAEEQYALNQKQVEETKALDSADPLIGTLMKQLRSLTKLLASKIDILESQQEVYTEQITQLREIRHSFLTLSQKFDQQIKERRRQDFFQRKGSPLVVMGWEQIREELGLLKRQGESLVSGNFWSEQFRLLWRSGGFLLITSALLFGITQFLLLRLRQVCIYIREWSFSRQHAWRCFALQLFYRSLPLLGATVFLYVYAQLRLFYSTVPLVQTIVYILLILLFCRWGLDAVTLWNQEGRPAIPERIVTALRLFLIQIRGFAVGYAVLEWFIGSNSVILLLGRVVFEIALIAWSVFFWRIFRKETAESFWMESRFFSTLRSVLVTLGYTIAVGGFLLELAGYGQVALYWYLSWGRTAIVLVWAGILFMAIKEMDQEHADLLTFEPGEAAKPAQPIRWFLIRLSWLIWMGALSVSILLAWGAKQAMIIGFFRVLNYPIPLGDIRLRLFGIVYALLILFFTHAATRLWRLLLQKRVLVRSGMELGLQESITTISVYLLWMFGILASLHALGISTTSLAVVFGALSIGLGFGLQNIFNNFISGLILLFERPIQVGDVVELNGVWGTVTKINVRSTVVQTFDNASLIIPNSEFISGQLTNWSFKDFRVRRNITVGVAYGSDTELVRQTLLEIAEKHPNVLKHPRSDVLFTDFGDSALIFKLRVWALVNQALSTETEIRFEIDRLFREREIEIPFPQRDIHIRSVKVNAPIEVDSGK